MSAGPCVRTVLGDIPPAELGVTDAHDHFFLRSPQLAGQELDDPSAAKAAARSFHDNGGRSVVQWTPFGMGRRAAWLAELSLSTGVHVVAATGLHQAAHYDPALLERIRPTLAALFVAELTEGLRSDEDPDGPTGPRRAGLIKVAGGYHGLDAHARHTMTAAAEAHHATGAPIAVHCEMGTAALEVLDLLCHRLGVPPERVLVGHLNRFPDPTMQARVAKTGAYLVFDGPSRAHHVTDWRLMESLGALVTSGHAHQLLLGADTTTAAARADGPTAFLAGGLRDRVELELGARAAQNIFVRTPAQALAVDWR